MMILISAFVGFLLSGGKIWGAMMGGVVGFLALVLIDACDRR